MGMKSMVEDTRGAGIYLDRIEMRKSREIAADREGHPKTPDYSGCYGDDGLPMWSDVAINDPYDVLDGFGEAMFDLKEDKSV
jgi:hypothetical protein